MGEERAQRMNMLSVLLEKTKPDFKSAAKVYFFKISNTEFTIFTCTQPGHMSQR